MENPNQFMPYPFPEMTTGGPTPMQAGAMNPAFPGPTPSPWPPSPMTPGPTMQPQGAPGPMPQDQTGGHAESQGHSCGKSAFHSHPGDSAAHSPSMPHHDYLHEAFQFGPAYFSPAVGIHQPPDVRLPVPYQVPAGNPTFLGLDFRHDQFWKGAILGAAVVFIVTNDTMQKALMTGMAKLWTTAQAGIEELKEKYQDVKAEMNQKK